jgi:16S rRNA (adenine1518-N6/adenine1519-N6)-dimethyltransferase
MNLTDYNEIQELLHRHGFRFSKSMGQNFLTASWVPADIADSAQLDSDTAVLEIGPGVGCLTEQLALRAGKVLSVELDRSLEGVLRETMAAFDNVEILFGDVLKQDLPALVGERLTGLRPVVCANLPYNVTSPLLTAFLEADCFEEITVMVQREVAQRICAGPGTAQYGAFSILCQWYSETELLFDVPPSCFVPRPKVTSSVIRLRRRSDVPAAVEDRDFFFRVVRAAFNQRRKTLPNALASGLREFSKQELQNVIIQTGFSENIRGEALSIHDFAQIANALTGR